MMPRLIMIRLDETKISRITVVKPGTATPVNFCTSAMIPKTMAIRSIRIPSHVIMCSGNEVKERLDYSVVKDSKTGDLIIKVVSLLPKAANLKIDLGEVAKEYNNTAELYELSITNNPDRQREWEVNKYQDPIPVTNSELTMKVSQYSVSVLRIKKSSSKH